MLAVRTFRQQSGFTLVEMIVALAVFSVVVTISLGALLMLIATNQQLQAKQSVMTNLSFALDSMTREIRTGTHYYCGSAPNDNSAVAGYKIFLDNNVLTMGTSTNDCLGKETNKDFHGLAFIEGGQSITSAPSTRIVYFFNAGDHKIYRRISGQAAQPIVSSGIYIEEAEFFVTGSQPRSPGSNTIQPTVTIFIKAKESANATESYEIQTTVTQRTLDI